MSTESEKRKHGSRIQKTDRAIKRQTAIAKQHNFDQDVLNQSHRFSKRHAMDCGNPGCALCGNPRHKHKDGLTVQEKRFYQDVEAVRDSHSNGLKSDDDTL